MQAVGEGPETTPGELRWSAIASVNFQQGLVMLCESFTGRFLYADPWTRKYGLVVLNSSRGHSGSSASQSRILGMPPMDFFTPTHQILSIVSKPQAHPK